MVEKVKVPLSTSYVNLHKTDCDSPLPLTKKGLLNKYNKYNRQKKVQTLKKKVAKVESNLKGKIR